ncbi:MAG: hypothetical protein IT384_19095 [Deltaproteobacteria bacterium]|nr:hypothetical protein [Deltaproteobacteria bacterium]
MFTAEPPTHRRIALALLILGVGFRAWAVGHARFTGDESYFWATARNIATFEAAPVYGPSLTGSGAYHPGPIFYYLMALPQRLGASPWWGGLFVVLLHGGAAVLLASIAHRSRGMRCALFALALWAFAPWDVLYADRIWLSCVAPVWGTLLLYAATRLEAPRWQGALVFLAVVCPQLHMSAPIVWGGVALMIALGPKIVWRWRALAIGAALAVLAYAPPIYWELTHGFTNTRAILSEGGGHQPWETVAQTPLKVALYALLYSTSEISYHFQTGYWRPFDDLAAYGTLAGWRTIGARLGASLTALDVFTVLLALGCWLVSLAALASRGWAAARAKSRSMLGPEQVLLCGLLTSLLLAMVLMMMSRKLYFPHYTNLLMPVLLFPVAAGLDRLVDRFPRAYSLILGGLAASMLAMAVSTSRYYLEVDRKNGLEATLGMIDEVISGPAPIELRFDGFNNRFAWEMLANTKYKHPLRIEARAPVRWQVKNNEIAALGVLPDGATVHDGVLLLRSAGAAP